MSHCTKEEADKRPKHNENVGMWIGLQITSLQLQHSSLTTIFLYSLHLGRVHKMRFSWICIKIVSCGHSLIGGLLYSNENRTQLTFKGPSLIRRMSADLVLIITSSNVPLSDFRPTIRKSHWVGLWDFKISKLGNWSFNFVMLPLKFETVLPSVRHTQVFISSDSAMWQS